MSTNQVEYIPSSDILIPYEKPWLANIEDIERYIDALRKAYFGQIKSGKRIHLS